MLKNILRELKAHSPFTQFGALTGIILLFIFKGMPHQTAHTLFYCFHPLHVCLSAFVTTALYKRHLALEQSSGKLWVKVFLVGFFGSVGIGTLSDSIIPYLGEVLLDMPHRQVHIGFIEKWWLVNPVAIASIIFAYYKPVTKIPHAGHVLISTWASLFHILMANDYGQTIPYFGIFLFLFIAVWLPCCVSDIVFPLLFVKNTTAENSSRGGKRIKS